MDRNTRKQIKVAVIGSGMAGLVTAWALNGDAQGRYQVEVYESGVEPSLDSASLSVINPRTHEIERVDVPMRTFTEGYYHNLKALYDHLGVRCRVQPFIFTFTREAAWDASRSSGNGDVQYFVHASNNHRMPPLKPKAIRWTSYISELLFALLCYLWFTLCCFAIHAQPGTEKQPCESLDKYLRRIKLPQYFVRLYLLPLFSAVTTCSHRALLNFPAKDIIDYRRRILFGSQMVVINGVNQVQTKLLHGLSIRFSTCVKAVTPMTSGLKVVWETQTKDGRVDTGESFCDKVILAVSPDVVGAIFEPLREEMKYIPTAKVKTVTHVDDGAISITTHSEKDLKAPHLLSRQLTGPAHLIRLRTSNSIDDSTQATHVLPSGAMVTSCPLSQIDESKILDSHTFTRVLRTPDSRRRLQRLFGPSMDANPSERWKNGDDGVWLVGSWCWDGVVLLEGCVVSAIRVAKALDVETPFLASSPHLMPAKHMICSSTAAWRNSPGWYDYQLLLWPGVLSRSVCKWVFILTRMAIRKLSRSFEIQHDTSRSQLYGLEHGILNFEPPKTMWMNMGYWKDQTSPLDFPLACRKLLEEVIKQSGITDASTSSNLQPLDQKRVNLVDLGFGCGDQSIYLAQLDWVSSYTGITLNRRQFDFAEKRLSGLGLLQRTPGDETKQPVRSVQIFCANGAQPQYWKRELHQVITENVDASAKGNQDETWVLALDVLHHFSPSRQAIFNHSCRELRASIMTYDLLLPDSSRPLSSLERVLLLFISYLTATPYSNYLTPEQYRKQLVSAGYRDGDVDIHDVSEYVFAPLVKFLKEQDQQLQMLGKGLGVFHVPKWIFAWWARSGVVRGCIVVAKRRREAGFAQSL